MPHLRAPDQPKTKIDVVYGEGKGELDVFAQGMRSVGLLEAMAERAAASRSRGPSRSRSKRKAAATSTRPGSPTSTSSSLCYELVADFADLYRGYGETRRSGRNAQIEVSRRPRSGRHGQRQNGFSAVTPSKNARRHPAD